MSIEELSKIIQKEESSNDEVRSVHDQLSEVNRHLEKIAKGARLFHMMCYFVGAMTLIAAIPVVLVIWPHFPRFVAFVSEHLEHFNRFR
jgi:hypothetical protein